MTRMASASGSLESIVTFTVLPLAGFSPRRIARADRGYRKRYRDESLGDTYRPAPGLRTAQVTDEVRSRRRARRRLEQADWRGNAAPAVFIVAKALAALVTFDQF
jgi:hypothetical protein